MKKIAALVALSFTLVMCNKNPDDKTINLFTVEDDMAFGAQTDSSIKANPSEFPLLNEDQYPASYAYLTKIRNKILNSGKVYYKDKFKWEIKIIKDDNTLNAFCTPGGYIYVYTGLIKYLDSEEQLAGVLGHEMAHADRRHSTDALTQQLGIEFLLQAILGKDPGVFAQLGETLLSLSYSKTQEAEADDYSVIYLCPTDYKADGAAAFFEKLQSGGQGSDVPEFLSTHPDPDKRVEAIRAKKAALGCTGTASYIQEYSDFKNTLP